MVFHLLFHYHVLNFSIKLVRAKGVRHFEVKRSFYVQKNPLVFWCDHTYSARVLFKTCDSKGNQSFN